MENLPPIDEREAARVLGVKSFKTLQSWRTQRVGPPYLKIGRAVRYRIEDLHAFMNAGRVDPQQQAAE